MGRKKKEPSGLMYFSPKHGEMRGHTPSTKEPFARAVEIIAKAKTKTVMLMPNCMVAAPSNDCQIVVSIELGEEGVVNMKDLKDTAKVIEGPFSVTRLDGGFLQFSWGDGNYTAIPIAEPDDRLWDLGVEQGTWSDSESRFASALFLGGSAVAKDHKIERFNHIEVNDTHIISTDGRMLCRAPFQRDIIPGENAEGLSDIFNIPGTCFQLWAALDLPLLSWTRQTLGTKLNLAEGVEIWAGEKLDPLTQGFPDFINDVLNRVLNATARYEQFPSGSWGTVKLLHGCKELVIADKLIGSPGGVRVATDYLPFNHPDKKFIAEPKQFSRLKNLTSPYSVFGFSQVEDEYGRQASYVAMVPEPDQENFVLLAGLAQEKE